LQRQELLLRLILYRGLGGTWGLDTVVTGGEDYAQVMAAIMAVAIFKTSAGEPGIRKGGSS